MAEEVYECEDMVDHQDPEPGIRKLLEIIRPHWNSQTTTVKGLPGGGLVNVLLLCSDKDHPQDRLIARINSPSNKLPFACRDYEYEAFKTLSKEGLCMPVFCRFGNGIIYKYADGRNMTAENMKDPAVVKTFVEKIKKLNAYQGMPVKKKNLNTKAYPFWTDAIETFWNGMPEKLNNEEANKIFRNEFPELGILETEKNISLNIVKELVSRYPPIFCHQDLHIANIVYNPQRGEVSFVDWELCGYSVLPFELAKAVDEWADLHPDEALRRQFIAEYLDDASEPELDQMYRDVMRALVALKMAYVPWGPYVSSTSEREDEQVQFMRLSVMWYGQWKKLFDEVNSFTDGFYPQGPTPQDPWVT